MSRYTVSVVGPQYGEPKWIVGALAHLFQLPTEIREIYPPDRVICTRLTGYRGHDITFSGIIPALLHYEQTYTRCLTNVDGIIYVLSASRANEWVNRDDFRLFSQIYATYSPKAPVVTALNDLWCGNAQPGLFTPPEVSPYVLPGSPVIETKLSNECADGGFALLDTLLDLLSTTKG